MRFFIFPLMTMLLLPLLSTGQEYGWRSRYSGNHNTVGINPLNPNAVFAAGVIGLVVSYDLGDSWTTLGNPGLTDIRQILVHPADTAVIFCIGFTDGLRRTSDNGATWTTVLTGVGIDGESLCLDPARPDTMYLGNFLDGAIYRSTDRGVSWEYLSTTGSELCAMAVRPDSSAILFAGTGGGTISKSTDGGFTWRLVKEGGSAEIPKIVIDPSTPMTAYGAGYQGAVSAQGIWKTTDGGEGWFLTSLVDTSIWALDIDHTNPDVVYGGIFTFGGAGVYKTTDGGMSWDIIADGLPLSFSAWSLKVHPMDPEIVWLAGNTGIYRLLTALATVEGAVLDAASLDTVRNGFVELASTGERILLDQSGGTYTFSYFEGDPSPTSTTHSESYPYYLHDEGLEFIPDSILRRDILLTRLPFTTATGLVEDSLGHFPLSARIILTETSTTSPGVRSATTNPDGTFEIDSLYITYPPIVEYGTISVDASFPHGSISVSPVVLDSVPYFLGAEIDTADVLITSSAASGEYTGYYGEPLTARGFSYSFWDPVVNGPAPLSRTGEVRKALLIYYTGDDTLPLPQNELDSLGSALQQGIPMMISGQNFVEVNSGSELVSQTFGLAYGGMTTSTICRGKAGDLFDDLIFFTSGGEGANNQTSRDILAVAGPAAIPSIAYGPAGTLGTAAVRYESNDLGANVVLFGFGFEAVNLDQTRETMIQNVIGYLEGSIVLAASKTDGIPVSFGLEQNYPNPFNPTTRITYSVGTSGPVTLKVFDLLGKEIAVLVSERKGTGRYEVIWDGRGQPSGVYFYRLEAGGLVETRRMILLK